MKTMNFKLFTLLLTAILTLGLTACGGGDDEPTPDYADAYTGSGA